MRNLARFLIPDLWQNMTVPALVRQGVFSLMMGVCLIAGTGQAQTLSDSAPAILNVTVTKVTDGDSLRAGPLRLRLYGIDAPEAKQTCYDHHGVIYGCGQAATAKLAELVNIGDRVECELIDIDRYQRLIARCRNNRVDLNRQMVRSGWAVAYQRYSRAFIADEHIARNDRAGLWAGQFQRPEDWRRSTRK